MTQVIDKASVYEAKNPIRTCKKCGTTKAIGYFIKVHNPDYKHLRRHTCKSCWSKYQVPRVIAWQNKPKNHFKDYFRKWNRDRARYAGIAKALLEICPTHIEVSSENPAIDIIYLLVVSDVFRGMNMSTRQEVVMNLLETNASYRIVKDNTFIITAYTSEQYGQKK